MKLISMQVTLTKLTCHIIVNVEYDALILYDHY